MSLNISLVDAADIATIVGSLIAAYIAFKQLPALSKQLAKPKFYAGFRYIDRMIDTKRRNKALAASDTLILDFAELDRLASVTAHKTHPITVYIVNYGDVTAERVKITTHVPSEIDPETFGSTTGLTVGHLAREKHLHPGGTYQQSLELMFPKKVATYKFTSTIYSKDQTTAATNPFYVKIVKLPTV